MENITQLITQFFKQILCHSLLVSSDCAEEGGDHWYVFSNLSMYFCFICICVFVFEYSMYLCFSCICIYVFTNHICGLPIRDYPGNNWVIWKQDLFWKRDLIWKRGLILQEKLSDLWFSSSLSSLTLILFFIALVDLEVKVKFPILISRRFLFRYA